jgi:hypothetical protein
MMVRELLQLIRRRTHISAQYRYWSVILAGDRHRRMVGSHACYNLYLRPCRKLGQQHEREHRYGLQNKFHVHLTPRIMPDKQACQTSMTGRVYANGNSLGVCILTFVFLGRRQTFLVRRVHPILYNCGFGAVRCQEREELLGGSHFLRP